MIQTAFIVFGVILGLIGLVDFVRTMVDPNYRRRGWYERFPWMVPYNKDDCKK